MKNFAINWKLLGKYLTQEISVKDKKLVDEWLNSDNKNQLFLNQVKEIWEASAFESELLNAETKQSWKEIKKRIQPGVSQYTQRKQIHINKKHFQWISGIAASLLIGFFFIYMILYSGQRIQYTMTSADNQIKELQLNDGSGVIINENSQLTYPKRFANKIRTVSFKGEAFFNITSDPEKPFQIHVNGAIIKVLGTSFNIKSLLNNYVIVTVTEGQVALITSTKKDTLIIPHGNQGTYDLKTGLAKLEKTIDPNFLSWKTKILNFDHTTLREIIYVLEDYYDITIQVHNEAILDYHFKGFFDDAKLEEVLDVISFSMDLTYKIDNNIVVLKSKNRTVLSN